MKLEERTPEKEGARNAVTSTPSIATWGISSHSYIEFASRHGRIWFCDSGQGLSARLWTCTTTSPVDVSERPIVR